MTLGEDVPFVMAGGKCLGSPPAAVSAFQPHPRGEQMQGGGGDEERAPVVAAAAAALSFPAFPCAAPVTTRRYASPRSGAPDVPARRGDAPAGPGLSQARAPAAGSSQAG